MAEAPGLFGEEPDVLDAERVTTTTGPLTTPRALVATATAPGGKRQQQDRWLLLADLHLHLPPAARPLMDFFGIANGHGERSGWVAEYIRLVRHYWKRLGDRLERTRPFLCNSASRAPWPRR